MSGATYRIECEHKPSSEDDSLPWVARVFALSNPTYCEWAGWEVTSDRAVSKARAWIALQAKTVTPPADVFTDDDGNIVAAPTDHLHSVKA